MSNEDASTSNVLPVLKRLKSEMPEVWDKAQVVGQWVWLEFTTPPLKEVRDKLRQLGFHWNRKRRCWQNPCGMSHDPKTVYSVKPATEMSLAEKTALEYKVVSLRECPLPEDMLICDTPAQAVEYWRLHVATAPYFNQECECFVVLMLNTRRRVKGHQLVSIGTMDTLLVHPREVFRAATILAAAAVVLMHNHPSGEPQPSEADIKVTRDLIRAGQLMKIEVLDHVVIGNKRHQSLRELGYIAGT